MTKNKWREIITAKTKEAGTYNPVFDLIITELAEILEERDKVYKEYKKNGGHPIIEYTNKRGATNFVKSPFLQQWESLKNTALPYWRDLGLTPAALKKIDEKTSALKTKEETPLDRLNDVFAEFA